MTLRQPLFILRVAKLILTSSTFFVVVGPAVGALAFFPMVGLLAALMAGYPFGALPALLAGVLNALVLAVRLRWRPSVVPARWAHALTGGLCGILGTLAVLAIVDGPWLVRQITGSYDFWYTINRLEYVPLSTAGLLAGVVCGAIFNPWGERLMKPRLANSLACISVTSNQMVAVTNVRFWPLAEVRKTKIQTNE